MRVIAKCVVAIYVDKSTHQWIVRDEEGEFWSLPSTDNPWHERQPFTPAEGTELAPVPGHYKYLLGLSA